MVAAYRKVWPFLLMGGLAVWLLKGDVVLLGGLRGGLVDTQSLSFYAAGTRLTEACLLLAAPLGNVLLGRFTQLAKPGAGGGLARGRRLRKLALWLTVGLTLAGGLVVLAAAWGGGWLMRGVFGEAYVPAGALLPWVLGMLPFALGSVVLVPLLNSLERERGLAVCMGAGGVVLGLVMPWMAMTWGVRGAAIGVALAHAVVFVAGWVLAWEAMRDHAEKSV
jgi:O-antigen/teichoic acid export membrane protein